jgi:cytochrome oxidase Cu insertion factor (SCO1/SenC/PrrC family)
MTAPVIAANAVLAAALLVQAVLWHPAAAFAQGQRRWWPTTVSSAALTLADGTREPLLKTTGAGTLLVLGTTRCNDACTVTLTTLQRTFALAPAVAKAWQVRFVSVGGDDAVAAGCFGSFFDGRFTGGTLAAPDTRRLVEDLQFKTWQVAGPDGQPALRHDLRIEVIDRQGRWLATYGGRTPPAVLVADLQRYRTNEPGMTPAVNDGGDVGK